MSDSDSWQTPNWLFKELNEEFRFDIDLCATKENSKCDIWYQDYLKDVQVENVYDAPRVATMKEYQEIGNANYVCFMNPPYSNPKPFVEKAWEDSKHCKIVCLVKCDPSTKWWATFWDYAIEMPCTGVFEGTGMTYIYNGPKPGCEVRFFPKRIKFDPPQELLNSGKVWKVRGKANNQKWVQECNLCFTGQYGLTNGASIRCKGCNGKGYKELSGATFSSALIIMDRRNV